MDSQAVALTADRLFHSRCRQTGEKFAVSLLLLAGIAQPVVVVLADFAAILFAIAPLAGG